VICGKARVLIVEDENIIALDIKRTLIKLGYEPLGSVPSGERAIEAATEEHPDVILMDINLKGKLNGVQAAEIILSSNDIPIVFLSALNNIQNFSPSGNIKTAGHLVKPFEEQELFETINKALAEN
jgi:CheY-like chemotaxis protein